MSDYEEQLAAMKGYGDKMPGEQGSPEWMAERCGCCTASRFKDVMDFTKAGKEGAKRAAYRMELVVERLTGKSAEHYVNAFMEWGTATEPLARMAYEQRTGAMVLVPGFIRHKTLPFVGGSPDGLIDDDGGVEFKCPATGTHINTILSGECDHLPQIHGLMWITGRKWWDFISYDPRLPDGLNLFVKRIPRDDDYIAELGANVIIFLHEVDDLTKRLSESVVHPVASEEPPEDPIPPLEL